MKDAKGKIWKCRNCDQTTFRHTKGTLQQFKCGHCNDLMIRVKDE